MSSECLYNMQKARAAITPRKHTVQIAAFQNSKQSSLYSYEVKAFFFLQSVPQIRPFGETNKRNHLINWYFKSQKGKET